MSLVIPNLATAPLASYTRSVINTPPVLKDFRLVFDEKFPLLAAEGEFFDVYKDKWWQYDNFTPDTWTKNYKNTHGGKLPATPSGYHKSVVSVKPTNDPTAGNAMVMRLRNINGWDCSANPIPKITQAWPFSSLAYGKIRLVMRAINPIPGYKVAHLLWPDSDKWPRDGEIDWPEGQLNGTIGGFMHNQGGTSGGDQQGPVPTDGATFTPWHSYELVWTPGKCQFVLDDVVRATYTERVPNTPMHWSAQTETSLGNPRPIKGQEMSIQISSVTLWQYQKGYVASA